VTDTERKMRVLVLDDDVEVGELVGELASMAGLAPVVTQDPDAFYAELNRQEPELIVLDLQMPQADGIVILRELAATGCKASVLIVSGMDRRTVASAEQFALQSGLTVFDTMQKPFAPENMVEKLKLAKQTLSKVTRADLERAIENGELMLHYQPVIHRIGENAWRAESAEALLRWQHPQLGRLAPAQFLGLIDSDRSELMRQLTDFVLQRGIEQLRAWQNSGHHIGIRVNVAAGLIADSSFPDRLETILNENQTDPDLLTLEIHDLAVMDGSPTGYDILTRLRLKNIRLALDDFGADTASLHAICTLPFSEVKVDRQLVDSVDRIEGAKTLVSGLVATLQKMSIGCCAVGIERTSQLEVLDEIRCDRAQGFLVGEPMPASELSKVLARRTAVPGSEVAEASPKPAARRTG